MAVFAAPLKGPAAKAAVGIVTQFTGKQFGFAEKDGKFTTGSRCRTSRSTNRAR